jgi:hypothetical protein
MPAGTNCEAANGDQRMTDAPVEWLFRGPRWQSLERSNKLCHGKYFLGKWMVRREQNGADRPGSIADRPGNRSLPHPTTLLSLYLHLMCNLT